MSAAGSLRRARSRCGWRSWLAVSGLATVLVLPFVVSAARVVTFEAALRQGVSELEPGDRSVTVSIVDSTGQGRYGTLDPGVKSGLRDLGGGVPVRQVIYREVSDTKGGGFVLGGADGLARLVRITQGRLPAECRPERCEVVQVGDSTSTTFDAGVMQSSFGLVVVGRAERTDDLLLSGTFEPTPSSPLLIGDGTQAVVSLAALSTHGRTYGWVIPVDLGRVVDIGADAWLERATRTTDDLNQVHPFLVLTLPNDAVREQARRAEASAGGFGFAGGALPVVLLGIALVGAAGLRRDHASRRWAFRLRGATGRLRSAVTVGEALFGVALAIVLAAVVGLAICVLMASRSPLGLGRVARSALGGSPTAGLLLAVACAPLMLAALVDRKASPPSSTA